MVKEIQSKEVIDKISDDLKIQPAEEIPRKIDDKITLNYNVNPVRVIQFKNGTATDATAATIVTSHPTKRTFVVGAHLATAKSVLSTSLFSAIKIVPLGGASLEVFLNRYEPLIAGQFNSSITFPFPIEVDKASVISVTNSTNVASIDTTGVVYFYETDPQ